MGKYRVYGHTNVLVAIDVLATSKADALEFAKNARSSLKAFAGNGGTDKLVGVEFSFESVSANQKIVYTSVVELKS